MGIVASGIQLIYEITILSMGAFRTWVMEQQFDGTDDQQMKDFVHSLGLGDWFVLHQIGKNTNEEFFHKLIKNLSILKAAEVVAAAAAAAETAAAAVAAAAAEAAVDET